METALILTVPEAEPVVSRWRRAYDPSASAGMPAHVTLIYPFRPSERIDGKAETALAAIFSATPPIELRLAGTRRFPGVLWLAPDNPEPIVALVKALASSFPDCRPYGGAYAEIVPHLTVADLHRDAAPENSIDRIALEFQDDAAGRLPVVACIEAASLFRNQQGRWRETRMFGFGA